MTVIRIHPLDSVAVAIEPLVAGAVVTIDGAPLEVGEAIDAGHKIALQPLAVGDVVTKYGHPIGVATTAIALGAWVHSHNLRTGLEAGIEYRCASRTPRSASPSPQSHPATFEGFKRANGRVGTRNEIWILNTVACVNQAAARIAREASARLGGGGGGSAVDGVHSFPHPYGCSQLGDDLGYTRKVLAGLLRHPNAGGVLLLGLGCENNQMTALLDAAPGHDPERVRAFNAQQVGDEVEQGVEAVLELAQRMELDRRTSVPASALVLGHKCGASDGLSGITANPLVGRIADRVTGLGGTVLLTEVPEMFGAEEVLLRRAASAEICGRAEAMIEGFKEYFVRHGQAIFENPSPVNRDGGLTTLEEKSLGAVQKGGRALITDVLRYGERARRPGLSLLEAPGNDGVSSTAMVASGATLLLFTTGRGTPLGFPVPTLKISSNSTIAAAKPHWIDFDAGRLVDGRGSFADMEEELFALILDIASGRARTRNEQHDVREIAIWKDGVTL